MPKKAPHVDPLQINLQEDAVAVRATGSQLKSVAAIATTLVDKQAEHERLTKQLSVLTEQIKTLAESVLPEAMDACNMKEFTLKDGSKVVVEPVTAGSIPKKNLVEALAWLRKHKHGHLIKTVTSVALGKGSEAESKKLKAALKKLGVEVATVETVHPQTLGAWAREMLAKGESFPLDLLGIWNGRRAKVTEGK